MSNCRKKIILDCDPGMDDSMAIVMAAKSEALNLLAVTTVMGNYPVEITSENALKMMELLGKMDIPVARGMASPMVRPAPKDPFTHGKDGQAENYLPKPRLMLDHRHAVDLMIDLILANPDEVYVICTGPMTNLAFAIQKEPQIKKKLAGVIAISGAFGLNKYAFLNATGDTPQSEWNVYVDPEAAEIVYNADVNLVALGLDVVTHFDVNFSEKEILSINQSTKREAQFLSKAIHFVNNRGYEAFCTIIDCVAVAYAIDPTLVKLMSAKVGIETNGKLSYGMTVIDRRHHHAWEHLPEVNIGCEVDYERLLKLLLSLILSD